MKVFIRDNSRRVASIIAAGICYSSIMFPPFLFGSREPTTVALWCIVLGAGLMLASPAHLRQPHWRLLAMLLIIVMASAFVLHEQLAETPWFAPFDPVWKKAAGALSESIAPSVSVVRDEPYFALGLPLANVLATVLGLMVGADSRRAQRAMRLLAWAAACYAIYGIYALIFTPGVVLWREKVFYIGNLTSTFVNRNTAATYFGSCSVVCLVLLMEDVRNSLPGRTIDRAILLERVLFNPRQSAIVLAVMMLICLTALFLTNSRAGIFISLGVLIMTFIVYFWRDLREGGYLIAAFASSAGVVILLLLVMGGSIESRIRFSGLIDQSRWVVDVSTLDMIRDRPLFGSGLGTYQYAFPAYRSDDISIVGTWDFAHNTYLQMASEMGLPLTLLIAAGWLVALFTLARSFAYRRKYLVIPLCTWSACLIGLLHSAVDFSFQIAGYSITMFALLGIGLSQAVQASLDKGKRQSR